MPAAWSIVSAAAFARANCSTHWRDPCRSEACASSPSDHGNSLAARVGQLVSSLVAFSILAPRSEEDQRRRRRDEQQLRLFEGFPKGLRLRPGMRYQEAAFPGPATPRSNE
jgi:hypothetical protein